jgi:methylenetetrahydrofolate dehydrogenase (NADP+)/methenyltetrahydrofolate cyclohydrolase
MECKIFDGKNLSTKIQNEVGSEIEKLRERYRVIPKTSVILVGNDPSSELYTKIKQSVCKKAGIECNIIRLCETTAESELTEHIKQLNSKKDVHGILVQLPLPKHIPVDKIARAITPEKDIDGFNPINLGNVLIGNEDLAPCTPKGIVKILESESIKLEGKNIVIVNRSNIIGKPLSIMLLKRNATVIVCHSKTKNISEFTKNADIVIVGVGKPEFLKSDMIKDGAVVIDIGANDVGGGRICGDVDFKNVKEKTSLITPVPGGVGPMTVASLLQNILYCYKSNSI